MQCQKFSCGEKKEWSLPKTDLKISENVDQKPDDCKVDQKRSLEVSKQTRVVAEPENK